MKVRFIILLFTMSFFIVNCNNRNKSNSEQKVSENNLKENFKDFYNKFYGDSTFQISRVNFPLAGYNSDYDDLPSDIANKTGENSDDFKWDIENWKILKTVESNDSIFKKELNIKDTIVEERIYIPQSGFKIIRKFNLRNDKWFLEYYFYQNI